MNKALPDRKDIIALQLKVADEGCSRSFESLYHSFYPFLHSFAFRIIRSDFIADEIVSDVFVQIWKNRSSLKNVNNLRVFLYVAVKNTSVNYLYRSRKEHVSWHDEFSHPDRTLVENPFNEIEARELSVRLRAAVNNLPSRCQVIYRLIKEDGLKYTEAARVLNLSVKTIENQMGIALKRLSAVIQTQPRRG